MDEHEHAATMVLLPQYRVPSYLGILFTVTASSAVLDHPSSEPTLARRYQMSTHFTRRTFLHMAGTGLLGILGTKLASAAQPSAGLKSNTSTAGQNRSASTTRPVATIAMQRADELLRKMTIEEKAMQLSSVFPLALFNTDGTSHRQL
jgi:hypothetical protein